MKVIATATGFYGGQKRRVGEKFDVADGVKAKWFEPAEKAKPKEPKGKPEKAPQTLSELARMDHEAQAVKA